MGKIRKKFTKCGPFSGDTEFAREKFSIFSLNRHPSMADYGTVLQPHYPVFLCRKVRTAEKNTGALRQI